MEKNALQHDEYISVPLEKLSKYQNDLNSLRVIVQDMPVSYKKIYMIVFKYNISLFDAESAMSFVRL